MTTGSATKSLRWAVALCAVLALVAAGCGDDDEGPATGEATEVPTAEDAPEEMPEDAPEEMTEEMPEDAPEDAPEEMPEDAPEEMTEEMPEDAPEEMTEEMPEDAPPVRVVLLSNQAAGDMGPVDGMIAGLEASGAANGHETQFVEATDPAAFETQVRNLADSGADIIITTFFDLGSTVDIVAPDYPDTTFVNVVAFPLEQPNVNVVDYQFFKGAYIGGIYAAALTDSNKLGYIGGAPLPFAWADFNAFTDGARSVNPGIETTATFANGFEDPAGARELASGLYADGIDFIFTGAAASDLGVVEAAVENDGMVMVASDLSSLGPAQVAILVEIEWAVTIRSEIEHILGGGENGRYRLAGPETGEITFAVPDAFLAGASGDRADRAGAVLSDLDAAVQALIAGDLVVDQISEER